MTIMPPRRSGRLLTVVAMLTLAALLAITAPIVAQQEPETFRSDADSARLEALSAAFVGNLPYVPGEVLVRFAPGLEAVQQTLALQAVGAQARQGATRWAGDTLLVTGLDRDDTERAAAVLTGQPGVVYAQPNYLRHLHSVPNDAQYSLQWNFTDINLPRAWDINPGAGSGVTVAVLDSGITNFDGTLAVRLPIPPLFLTFGIFTVPFLRTPDFDHARVTGAAEFTPTGPWANAGRRVLFDTVGHGTHVAGTVAQQTNNAFGFAGVANGVTLMPVKVCFGRMDLLMAWGSTGVFQGLSEGACDDFGVVQGIHYAVDQGAQVLNLSLGGHLPSPADQDALLYAVSRGVFVAISAGNEGDQGNPTNYPAAYAAGIQGAVSVGATTPGRTRAAYSNFGSYVELAAPGGGCTSTADRIWQVEPNPSDLQAVPPRFDRYIAEGECGTSMASPHVAGAAALLRSQGITDPAAIEAALKQFAVDLGAPGRDVEYGYGLIDVRAALLGFRLGR